MNESRLPADTSAGGLLGVLPLCDRDCVRWVIRLAELALLVIVAFHVYEFGFDNFLAQWDLMLISGLAMFVLTVGVASHSATRFRYCLTRLDDRGIIHLGDTPLETFIARCEREADRWARCLSVILTVVMLAAFVVALSREFWVPRLLLGLAAIFMAYVAGGYLGRMAYYGQLGWILQRRRIPVHLDPWHADRTGGLSPVGELYFTQAMVVAIPAAYIAVWLLVMPVWPRDYTTRWLESYTALLAIGIAIEMLAFVVPLLSFHRIMVEEKNRWRRDVDRLYRGHTESARQLLEPGTVDSKKSFREALDIVERCYLAVDAMPTWPIDVRVKRWFAVNNILLILPLASEVIPGVEHLAP